jgi:hypothetical protein
MIHDSALAMTNGYTKPRSVSGTAVRGIHKVREGFTGICLSTSSGSPELELHLRRAADGGEPPVVGTGDSEVARKVHLSNVLNCGVEVVGGAIGVDVGE